MLKCLSGSQEIDIDNYQFEEQFLGLRRLSNHRLLHCPDPLCGGIVILHKSNLKGSHFTHLTKGVHCGIGKNAWNMTWQNRGYIPFYEINIQPNV